MTSYDDDVMGGHLGGPLRARDPASSKATAAHLYDTERGSPGGGPSFHLLNEGWVGWLCEGMVTTTPWPSISGMVTHAHAVAASPPSTFRRTFGERGWEGMGDPRQQDREMSPMGPVGDYHPCHHAWERRSLLDGYTRRALRPIGHC